MENQTRFDLNHSVLAWKAELATDPSLSNENVRELETHLLESISAHQYSGMDEQAAFAKARQQLGEVSKIVAEFAKDNLLRTWRNRVFWMATGVFIATVFGYAVQLLAMQLAHWARESLGEWAAVAMYFVVNITPVLCSGLLIATGRIQLFYSRLSWFFADRLRLGIAGVLLVGLACLEAGFNGWTICPLSVLGFALAIMPGELRATAYMKIEGLSDWRNSTRVWRDRLFWIALSQLVVGAWIQIFSIGANAYFQYAPGPKSPVTWLTPIILLVVLLLPMAAVGVALSKAWLSRITKRLRSPSRVLAVVIVLLLINSCCTSWHFYHGWAGLSRQPMTEWEVEFLFSSVTWLIAKVGFIVAMLWLARSQREMPAGEIA